MCLLYQSSALFLVPRHTPRLEGEGVGTSVEVRLGMLTFHSKGGTSFADFACCNTEEVNSFGTGYQTTCEGLNK
jgi:hypothetical protein